MDKGVAGARAMMVGVLIGLSGCGAMADEELYTLEQQLEPAPRALLEIERDHQAARQKSTSHLERFQGEHAPMSSEQIMGWLEWRIEDLKSLRSRYQAAERAEGASPEVARRARYRRGQMLVELGCEIPLTRSPTRLTPEQRRIYEKVLHGHSATGLTAAREVLEGGDWEQAPAGLAARAQELLGALEPFDGEGSWAHVASTCEAVEHHWRGPLEGLE